MPIRPRAAMSAPGIIADSLGNLVQLTSLSLRGLHASRGRFSASFERTIDANEAHVKNNFQFSSVLPVSLVESETLQGNWMVYQKEKGTALPQQNHKSSPITRKFKVTPLTHL